MNLTQAYVNKGDGSAEAGKTSSWKIVDRSRIAQRGSNALGPRARPDRVDRHLELICVRRWCGGERWFGFITDELIRRGSRTSVQALKADNHAWAKGWNEDPKPFTWTKPAEQILESIRRLLTRISGAGH